MPVTRLASLLCWAIAVIAATACQSAPAAPTSAPAKAAEPTKPAAAPAAPAAASPAAAASPVAAASSVAATSPAPSASPAAAMSVSGTIDGVDGRILAITTENGPARVQVPETTRLEKEGPGTTADLQPGLSVGVTSLPDGTIKQVRIFQQSSNIRGSQSPMAGPDQGNTMTNARIISFDGRQLVIDLNGQQLPFAVAASTEVVKPLPASFADFTAGKMVSASGEPGPNGLLVATSAFLPGPRPNIAC
jgi:hypothetical protein